MTSTWVDIEHRYYRCLAPAKHVFEPDKLSISRQDPESIVDCSLTTYTIADLWSRGISVGLQSPGDALPIYKAIKTHLTEHLEYWSESSMLVTIAAPIDDLFELEELAEALYPMASKFGLLEDESVTMPLADLRRGLSLTGSVDVNDLNKRKYRTRKLGIAKKILGLKMERGEL